MIIETNLVDKEGAVLFFSKTILAIDGLSVPSHHSPSILSLGHVTYQDPPTATLAGLLSMPQFSAWPGDLF